MYRVRTKKYLDSKLKGEKMKTNKSFESMLAECEAFGETLEFGKSAITQRYEPKGFYGVK